MFTEKIVLRTELSGFTGDLFVVLAGENQDRNQRRCVEYRFEFLMPRLSGR